MRKLIVFILLILFITSCGSYKYVPTRKRGAKIALDREVRTIKYKQGRLKAIAMAYPELVDTITTSIPITVTSESSVDTVEVLVQDTAMVDSLLNTIELLLLSVAEAPDTVTIDKIRFILKKVREAGIVADTSVSFVRERKILIDGVEVSAFMDAIVGIKGGKLFYRFEDRAIDTSIFVKKDNVTFDVTRLPKFVKGLSIVIGIVVALVVLFIMYVQVRKYLPF